MVGSYEPTNMIYTWELVSKRRKWERVEDYFGVMSEYERAGESGFNAKYGSWQKSPFYEGYKGNWYERAGLDEMGERSFE